MKLLREHPYLTALVVGCTLIGGALGVVLLTQEWPLWRRIAGGLLAGVSVGLLMTATRFTMCWGEAACEGEDESLGPDT